MSVIDTWFSAIGRAADYQTMVYYPGTGIDTYEFNFSGGYISQNDIKAFMVEDVYRERIDLTMTFLNTNTVKLNRVVPVGWTVCIYRDTPKSMPLAKFVDGAIINATNLDRNAKQAVFSVSEMVDRFDSTVEQVNTALEQVAIAIDTSNKANETANAANAKADAATATANEAHAKGVEAIESANTANATAGNAVNIANGAVTTANEAKATADGLNAQIIEANKTAGEAKSIAEGIDAKATDALAKATAAVATADAAKVTADAIDGKATSALDKATEALESVNVAKGLTDRVHALPAENKDIDWEGVQTSTGVNVQTWDRKHGTRLSIIGTDNGATANIWVDKDNVAPTSPHIAFSQETGNVKTYVNTDLVAWGATRLSGWTEANGITSTSDVHVRSMGLYMESDVRKHFWFNNGAGNAEAVMYKDPGAGDWVFQHGQGGAGTMALSSSGALVFSQNGAPDAGGLYGLRSLSFPPGIHNSKHEHWVRVHGDAQQDSWQFGLGTLEMVNFQHREVGGPIAWFNNDTSAGGTSMATAFGTHGGAMFYADGGITGPSWSNNGWSDAISGVNWCRDRANDAWNKAQDAQVDRVWSMGRAGQQYFEQAGANQWEAPAGCFLTGRNSAVGDGRNMGFYYRRMLFNKPSSGWIEMGDV